MAAPWFEHLSLTAEEQHKVKDLQEATAATVNVRPPPAAAAAACGCRRPPAFSALYALYAGVGGASRLLHARHVRALPAGARVEREEGRQDAAGDAAVRLRGAAWVAGAYCPCARRLLGNSQPCLAPTPATPCPVTHTRTGGAPSTGPRRCAGRACRARRRAASCLCWTTQTTTAAPSSSCGRGGWRSAGAEPPAACCWLVLTSNLASRRPSKHAPSRHHTSPSHAAARPPPIPQPGGGAQRR